MLTVNMLDAKNNLSKLVEQVESGKEPEVVIARNGKPAAKLVRFATKAIGKRIGVAKGCFDVPDSIDADNEEVANLFSSGKS
jgi:prevent-host-death family protein